MIDLDNKQAVLKTQGGGAVLDSINALPNQLKQAWEESQKIDFPESYRNIKNIVVCGMGASRFPAFITQQLLKEKISVPYTISDNYTIPRYVNENTLFILSSYSGTTEEVLYNGKLALERNAKLTGLCSGGDVADFLKKNNCPVYVFNPKHNPSSQPRIGFGYGVGAHLGILAKLGLINNADIEINNAIQSLPNLLGSFSIDVKQENNPTKLVSKQIYETYPYFIVSEFLTGVGNAVANQINETSKSISSFRVIPELNHHLMEGLKFPSELKKLAIFVFFFSHCYPLRVQKRFHITKDVVEQNNIKTIWIELKGKTKTEQVFELMGFGSYMSMYLAALYNVNPALIPYVDYFKAKLKE